MNRERLAMVAVALMLAVAGVTWVLTQEEEGADDQNVLVQEGRSDSEPGETKVRDTGVVRRPGGTRGDALLVDSAPVADAEVPPPDAMPKPFEAAAYGRVFTREGGEEKPLPDAVVAICRDVSDHRGLSLQGAVLEHTVTDARGRFYLGAIPSDARYLVRVEHPDFASRFVPKITFAARQRRRLDIEMKAGLTLRGTVTGLDGRPLAGAVVQVADQTMRVMDQMQGVEREGTTDSEGRFVIRNLTPGYKRVHAMMEGFATQSKSNVYLVRGDADPLKFVLGPGVGLVGRVIFDIDESPAAGVYVTAFGLQRDGGGPSSYPPVITDDQGRFRYEGLAKGDYRLTAAKPGALAPGGRTTARTGGEEVVIRVKRLPTLRGTVVDPSGNPVSRFSVVAVSRDSLMFASKRLVRHFTSEDGAFEYPCEILAPKVWLFAEAPGFAGGRVGPLSTQDTETVDGLRIQLVRGAEVTGRVVDASGKPVANASVRLLGVGGGSNPLAGFFVASLRGLERSARTDATGVYHIENVPSGDFRLGISAGGFAAAESQRTFQVRSGDPVRLPDETLLRGATLEGVVVNEQGQPTSGVTVKLSLKGTPILASAYTTRTDGAGHYRIEHIRAGIYRVELLETSAVGGAQRIFSGLGGIGAQAQEVVLGDEELRTMDLTLK